MAQKQKHYRVTVYNMNCGLGKNGKPTETEEVTVCARNQAEAERLAVSGGLVSRENGWGAWDSAEVDGKGHKVTPGKTKKTATKTATKTAKKTATKLTGKAREEKSAELFQNIREYNLLGFRIGDGLRNMFDTLVTAISKKKASVNPVYTYTVHGGTGRVVFHFGIKVAGKKAGQYTVDVVVNQEKPGKTGLYLTIAPKAATMSPTVKDFPFSEEGIREMLREIKVTK